MKPPYNSRTVGSRNTQGCFDLDEHNYGEAIKQFQQDIKANSELAVPHYNLGCAYLKTKDYDSAIDAFRKAIDFDSNFEGAYYNLSLAHLGKKDYEASEDILERALSELDQFYLRANFLLQAIRKAKP